MFEVKRKSRGEVEGDQVTIQRTGLMQSFFGCRTDGEYVIVLGECRDTVVLGWIRENKGTSAEDADVLGRRERELRGYWRALTLDLAGGPKKRTWPQMILPSQPEASPR